MSDPFVIMRARRLGYEIISDSNQDAWYREGNRLVGPFKTLDEAAVAAIDEDYVRTAERIFRDDQGETK